MRVVVLCLCVFLCEVSGCFAISIPFEFSTTSSTNQYLDSMFISKLGVELNIFSEIPNAQITQKVGGLGVSFTGDNSTTLDGSVGFDSLTFKFSQVVTLLEVRFSYFEVGDEFALSTANGNLAMDIPADIGAVDLSLVDDRFVFSVTDANDDYRIESITIAVDSPVPAPEPSTWVLLAGGLAGILFWHSRQTG